MGVLRSESYRILQVGRDAADTGGGRVIVETSLHLQRFGHEVTILSDVPVPAAEAAGLHVLVTPLGPLLKRWLPKSKALRTVRHFIQLLVFSMFGTALAVRRSNQGWIVLNHNLEVMCGDVLVLHNVFNVEHRDSGHGAMRKFARWFNPVFSFRILRERFMLAFSKGRIISAVSRVTRDEARAFVRGKVELRYINNGVNVDKFYPYDSSRLKLKNDLIGDAEAFVILFVGHEYERKGLRYVIASLVRLPACVRLLVLGGRGSSQSVYEKIARRLCVAERVDFLGTIMDTRAYYQMVDVFVLPSAYEALPLVGLEAMACGTPTLMTSVGGVPEFLENGKNGFFIERDPQSIVDKVLILMNDPERLQQMRLKARETALHYSWDKVAEQYVELIQEVAEEKARRA